MKKQKRKMMIKKREMLDKCKVEELSKIIFDSVKDWKVFLDARCVMLYHSFRNEVNTHEFIQFCLDNNKEVILPKSIIDGHIILPCRIKSVSELKLSKYGILEPISEDVVDKNGIDVVFVPGVAYDRIGFRLGYGAGFYDRFLDDYRGVKAGVCFEFQIIEDVFKDEHDVKMDYLVTEWGITKTGD